MLLNTKRLLSDLVTYILVPGTQDTDIRRDGFQYLASFLGNQILFLDKRPDPCFPEIGIVCERGSSYSPTAMIMIQAVIQSRTNK